MSIRVIFNDSLKLINTSLVELENNLSSKILENKDLEIFVKYTHECFNKSRPFVIKNYFRLYSYLEFFEIFKEQKYKQKYASTNTLHKKQSNCSK